MGIWDYLKVAEILAEAAEKAKTPPVTPGPIVRTEPFPWRKRDELLGSHGIPPRISFIDNVFREKVHPVEGSIICCDLGIVADHSGVYIGDGKIVHRDGGGYIAVVSPETFIERLDGLNNAISLYVSCRGENAAGLEEVAQRAQRSVKDPAHRGYNLLLKNCHQFCQYCLSGKEPGFLSASYLSLEQMLRKVYKMDNWRVWDR
ncbi:MAG: lecithin retinol acyltransferase family protein [Synergistaceae bacterium]|jgi:hypothetical protein|nr:lecithin retinol acyltransferase family protein [Synergistaceae bacterium]